MRFKLVWPLFFIAVMIGCSSYSNRMYEHKKEQKIKAELGDPVAQYYVGNMLIGASKLEGCQWILKSAQQGYSFAYTPLFKCYKVNGGFGSNPEEYKYWLKKSHNLDSKSIIYELIDNFGMRYEDVDWLIDNYPDIYLLEHIEAVKNEMRSNRAYVKLYNKFGNTDVIQWLKLKKQAEEKNISITKHMENLELERAVQEKQEKIRLEVESQKRKQAELRENSPGSIAGRFKVFKSRAYSGSYGYGKVTITNFLDTPVTINRVVINNRKNDGGCDFRGRGETRLGEIQEISVYHCGEIIKVDVYTNEGYYTYRLN